MTDSNLVVPDSNSVKGFENLVEGANIVLLVLLLCSGDRNSSDLDRCDTRRDFDRIISRYGDGAVFTVPGHEV